MNDNPKYPLVRLADDYVERLKSVPAQAWWADDDEPWLTIGSDPMHDRLLPYRVALEYGLVERLA